MNVWMVGSANGLRFECFQYICLSVKYCVILNMNLKFCVFYFSGMIFAEPQTNVIL